MRKERKQRRRLIRFAILLIGLISFIGSSYAQTLATPINQSPGFSEGEALEEWMYEREHIQEEGLKWSDTEYLLETNSLSPYNDSLILYYDSIYHKIYYMYSVEKNMTASVKKALSGDKSKFIAVRRQFESGRVMWIIPQ